MSEHLFLFLVLSVFCASIFVSMSVRAQQLENLSPQQIQQKAAEAGYGVDTTQIRQYEAAQKGSAAVSNTHAPCSLLHALCPTGYAPCFMLYALC